MPRGPKGEKRPPDVIGAAAMIGRIATGEVEDVQQSKNAAAVELGRLGGSKGGKARAKKLSPAARSASAATAATARWADSHHPNQSNQGSDNPNLNPAKPKDNKKQ